MNVIEEYESLAIRLAKAIESDGLDTQSMYSAYTLLGYLNCLRHYDIVADDEDYNDLLNEVQEFEELSQC